MRKKSIGEIEQRRVKTHDGLPTINREILFLAFVIKIQPRRFSVLQPGGDQSLTREMDGIYTQRAIFLLISTQNQRDSVPAYSLKGEEREVNIVSGRV